MKLKWTFLFAAALLFGAVTSARATVLIDNFTTTQVLNVAGGPGPNSATSTVSGGGIIGGTRKATITRFPPPNIAVVLDINNVNSGTAAFTTGSGKNGKAQAVLSYAGPSGTGFAATDLTQGGANDRLQFFGNANQKLTMVAVTLTDDMGHSATKSTTLFYDPTQNTLAPAFLLFAAYTGSGVDLTDITKISILLNSTKVPSVNILLTDIAAVPEPSTAVLAALSLGFVGVGAWHRRKKLSTQVEG